VEDFFFGCILKYMVEYDMKEIKSFLIHYVTDPGLSDEKLVELYCDIRGKWGFVETKNGKKVANIKNRDE